MDPFILCTYVHVYTCVYICIYIYTDACMHAYKHMQLDIHIIRSLSNWSQLTFATMRAPIQTMLECLVLVGCNTTQCVHER